MADIVALLVQASQDQPNNSVKHQETVSLLCLLLNYMFIWVEAASSFKKLCVRNTPGKLSIGVFWNKNIYSSVIHVIYLIDCKLNC